MEFRWDEWNVEHLAKHGVRPDEAEHVVEHASHGDTAYRGDGKYLAWGPGHGGRFLQVVFVVDEDGSVYVIHARGLTENEKRKYRKRWR